MLRTASVVLTGPRQTALSGVSTHLRVLMSSSLSTEFELFHFEVGREGRDDRFWPRLVALLTSPLRLAAALRRRRARIVHLNSALTVRAYWRDLVYLLIARLLGARVLYQVHGGALPRNFCRNNPVFMFFVRATLHLAAVVVTLSTTERRAFRIFLGSTPVIAIPNAINCSAYAAVVPRRSHPERPLRLLYIGRLVRDKGLFELLQALQLVRARGVEVELVIAGSGPDEPALRRCHLETNLPGVRFAGPVMDDGKLTLLATADAFVLPSHAEGLPYALLECMAAGVPAIATRVGAIPELISSGVNGLLVEPRDAAGIAAAIVRLASDRVALARMGEASRATVSFGFSVDRLTTDFAEVYAALCASDARRRAARLELGWPDGVR
jgi:glycosyltransferase involved in cell wall biosynthesis